MSQLSEKIDFAQEMDYFRVYVLHYTCSAYYTIVDNYQ